MASPRKGFNEPLNLFTVAGLAPGERKSPAHKLLTRPLEEWERSFNET